MAANSKTTRECTRSPKCSILLSNVLGISLTPFSLDVTDQKTSTTNDPKKPQYTGKSLFDSFVEENKSTLHTRLNESLLEIRFAGWIQPFTLLVKGPLEDLEVIKEAWRRRFLRSPEQFNIREIGTIKSVDTEIVQQAPFLPLTKAVYEAIASLNKNNLPSSQQNVFEYLAHTYQYVHVPKPNVIRDSLGILFKEGKVYSSGTDYFVLVDTQSDVSGDNKKEKKTTSGTEKTQEKHVRCVVCEASNQNTNSTHAQNVRNSKGTEHAHLCEKHKRGEKRNNKKENTAKETNLVNTSKEQKDSKSEKKDNKNKASSPSSANHSRKVNEKATKKTVWGQIAGFIKGKHSGTASETAQQQKPVSTNHENPEPTKLKSAAIPIEKQEKRVDSAPKLETQTVKEKRKPFDSVANETQTENPAQMQRSNSFAARTKTRPNLVRSNTFSAGSSYKLPRPVDYDIITSRIDEQSSGISTPDQHLTQPLTKEYSKKSSLAEKARYFNTNDFIRQSTSVKEAEKNAPTSEALPQRHNSFRGRNSSFEVREAERFSLARPGNHDSSRSNACAVGVVRPWSSHAPSARPDSRSAVSRTNSMKETRQFSLSSSCTTPTGDVNKPVLRDNRLVRRSSLREYRNSDCTPVTLQRYAGNMNREVFIGDSPLKHLLTKNTGNTLSVSPSHPNYIPAIQDRSRNSTPNRNSFPSAANNSFRRHSWREASVKELDHGCTSSEKTGFSYQDEKPKRHDAFSFDYTNRFHLSKGVIPCDCSDAGYSENCERRSVSSDPYHNTSSSIHKDEHSSIYSNSDYGILLDEISSSGSSEIQSIMNQERKALDNKTASPYTVAKGEVVLDSSLTFIGII